MKIGTTTHPKFRRLQKQLKLPQYAVAGLLEMIWSLAAQYADDGDISKFTVQEIADYCDWEADPNVMIDALVACRWLDRDGDRIVIHDWEDHRPNYVSDRLRKRDERRSSHKQSDNPGAVQDCPNVSENVQDSLGKSSPIQAKPSQAISKPNQISSAAAASLTAEELAEAEAEIFDLMESQDVDETMRQADKLRKADGNLPTAYIWEVAVISQALKPGFLSEVATGLRTKAIRKAKAYIDKALRDECEQRGLAIARIRARLPACPVGEVVS